MLSNKPNPPRASAGRALGFGWVGSEKVRALPDRSGRGRRRHRVRPRLRVVLLTVNVAAGLVQILMQILALGGAEISVGLVSPLFRPDGFFRLAQLAGFGPG